MLSGWGLQRLGHTMAAAAAAAATAAAAAMPGHEERVHQGMPHAWQAAAGTVPGRQWEQHRVRSLHGVRTWLPSGSPPHLSARTPGCLTHPPPPAQGGSGAKGGTKSEDAQVGRQEGPALLPGTTVSGTAAAARSQPHTVRPPCPPRAHPDLGEQAADELARLAEPLAEQAVGVDLNEGATLGVPAPSAMSGFVLGSVYARELEQQQGTSTKCTGS